jgi:uncharacterized membrane protein YqjE
MSTASHRDGILGSLCRIGETLLGSVQNRVELLANDMQEEKRRLVEAILLSATAAAFGLMTVALLTVAFVVSVWENGRIYALTGLSVVYGLAALWAGLRLRRRLAERTALRDTLNELTKDRECLNRNPLH